MRLSLLALLAWISLAASMHQSTNQLGDRSVIVHLFEWKWADVADECERFLGPKGYGGVQVSPPNENLIVELDGGRRPWWERYQPMSYLLTTRSGDRAAFLDMTTRCNAVGVRIYVDAVVNHMTGDGRSAVGTGGSTADFARYEYPAVPYFRQHFHPDCSIHDYNNAAEVRNCKLVGLRDLDLGHEHVRSKVVGFLNDLIHLGVAGFRVDAAKHMWPSDLRIIYGRLHHLNQSFGFAPGSRAYIYQEVIGGRGSEAVTPRDYTDLGAVTEFNAGLELSRAFRGNNPLKYLDSWGPRWGLLANESAFVFIDNHDNQRGHGGGGGVITYKESKAYKGAIAFMLAYPYGEPRVMSSFHFDSKDQGPPADDKHNILSPTVNSGAIAFMLAYPYGEPRVMSSFHFDSKDQGPPADDKHNILSPTVNSDDTCDNGWVCEHRWRQIYQMVGFRNAVRGTQVESWWSRGDKQIAFSRGNRGFIAFNIDNDNLDQRIKTNLPAGDYCDVISGTRAHSTCTGHTLTVDRGGYTHLLIPRDAEDTHVAIHVGPQSSLRA